MQNVYDLAHELARSLKETDQFKDYKKYKTEIEANESLKKMIEDFNKNNLQIQTAIMTGAQPDAELMQQVQNMYQVVMQDPTCANYLNTEMAFSTILSDIYKIIGEAIE